jgi:hypothetical protein
MIPTRIRIVSSTRVTIMKNGTRPSTNNSCFLITNFEVQGVSQKAILCLPPDNTHVYFENKKLQVYLLTHPFLGRVYLHNQDTPARMS